MASKWASDLPAARWKADAMDAATLLQIGQVMGLDDPAIWVRQQGKGQVITLGVAGLFSNRDIALKDNARFLSNLVAWNLSPGGRFIFDDVHQGAAKYYDAKAFFADARLHRTIGWLILLWFIFVLGVQRLGVPLVHWRPPDITAFVATSGEFLASTVSPRTTGTRLLANFFNSIRRSIGACRGRATVMGVAVLASDPAERRRRAAAPDAFALGRWAAHRFVSIAQFNSEVARKNSMSMALESFEQRMQDSLGVSVIGLRPVIRALTIAVIGRGHVLLQGPPGLGKTLLSKALAGSLGGSFSRVQGTADLMPSDIIGIHVFDPQKREFEFRPGPLFTDVLLVDEINRASPKTQSALLEAMEERQVTVERNTYRLPPQFLVIATQNPGEFEGTYPLPESQLDRFMLRIDMTYPQRDDEQQILTQYAGLSAAPHTAAPAVTAQLSLEDARAAVDQVHLAPELMTMYWSWPKPADSMRTCPWGCRPAAPCRCSRRRASRQPCAAPLS